jgi:hypothetical protein
MTQRIVSTGGPLPTRERLRAEHEQDDLAIRAAGRRAFWRSLTVVCPRGHGGIGVACFVVPSDAPGAGLGVGFCEGCDVPAVCPQRAQFAASLASA